MKMGWDNNYCEHQKITITSTVRYKQASICPVLYTASAVRSL